MSDTARLVLWWNGAGAPDRVALSVLAGPHNVDAFRALDGASTVAYVTLALVATDAAQLEPSLRASFPEARITRQHVLQDQPGASAGAPAPYHYVVATDVQASAEDDFNAWYAQEHLPGLARVPGTVRARRLRNADDTPRYHACYDLLVPETLGSPAWLAVRGTPWSDRVRPSFRNTTRVMMRRL